MSLAMDTAEGAALAVAEVCTVSLVVAHEATRVPGTAEEAVMAVQRHGGNATGCCCVVGHGGR